MIRTFLDSGVLLAAARSVSRDRDAALQVLEDTNRTFLTSPFVQLEVAPKAKFHNNLLESAFYHEFFAAAKWTKDLDAIAELAQVEAARSGVAAMDALHIAAAHIARADEFLTTERPRKPMYRTALVKIVYIFD
jgi:predicted nucleic acid-binding protein